MDEEQQRSEQIRAAERAHDSEDRFFAQVNASTIDSGNLALRSFILINGGAAIAMLAFLGALVNRIDGPQLASLAEPLSQFAWGVASAAFGTGSGYLTNYFIGWATVSKTATWDFPYNLHTTQSKVLAGISILFLLLSVVSAFASLGLFIMGMLGIEEAISAVFGQQS